MRKANVTILASIFIMALVAAGVGAGTMAWFSTTRTVPVGSIKTGTLSMSAPIVAFFSAPPGNWAPGESFTVEFQITNTGTLDINYIGGDLVITYDPKKLAEVIEVTSIYEGIPGYGWQESVNDGNQDYQKLVYDFNSPLTLKELADSYTEKEIGGNWSTYHTTDWVTGYGYDIVPAGKPCLIVGGTYALRLTLKLMGPETTNDYQNAPLQFKITFTGVQVLDVLP